MRPARTLNATAASRHRLRRRLGQTTALVALLGASPVLAQAATELPTGEDQPLIVSRNGAAMEIAPIAPRTVINWQTFNIGTDASVRFVNPAEVSLIPMAVLNRVVGEPTRAGMRISESQIRGVLDAPDNMAIYLVNPAGILFGPSANVTVGSLIASTRDVSDNEFTDITRDFSVQGLRFSTDASGTSSAPRILVGSQAITAGSSAPKVFRATSGLVGLIAAQIVTTGAISAEKEVALIAADDVTLTLSDATSPLKVSIAKGSQLAGSTPYMAVGGAIDGSSIIVAAATRNSVTDGLLAIDAALTATSAYRSDQGIVLAAGVSADANVTVPYTTDARTGALSDNRGAVRVTLGNTLTSEVGTATGAAGGGITMRSLYGVGDPPAVGGVVTRATLDADGAASVTADQGSVSLGDVTGSAVSLRAAKGDLVAGLLTVGTGVTSVFAGGGTIAGGPQDGQVVRGSVGFGGIVAGGAATVTGGQIGSVGGIAAAGDVTVTATASAITSATGLVALTAAAATGATADLTITGASVRGSAAGSRINLLAGDAVSVTATTGSLAFGTTEAGGIARLRAGTDAALGTVTAEAVQASAGGAVTATTLTGTGIEGTVVSVLGGTLDIGTATATLADVDLASRTGAATVGSINAGNDAALRARTTATVTGGGVVGRDLTVQGSDLLLGGAAGAEQSAGRNARYTATTGRIAGATTATGLVVRGDANTSDSVAGAILLDAATGIDLRGVSLVTGSGAANTGNVGVRLGTAGAPLVLDRVAANALVATDASRPIDGPVTLGRTDLVRSLTLATPGAISINGDVAISGAGERLSLTSGGSTVTASATTTLSAQNGVTVSGDGAVSLGAIAGGTGTVTLRSVRSTLGAGSVGAAGDVTLDAPGAMTLGDVRSSGGAVTFRPSTGTGAITAGAVRAASALSATRAGTIRFGSATSDSGAIAIAGTALTLGPVTADRGAVSLAATTGGINVNGATRARDDVTITAPLAVSLGDVTSVLGRVRFPAPTGGASGAIGAGAVRARGDLIVGRGAGLTFASATSETGQVSLTADGGTVRVNGPTLADTDVRIRGATVALGDVIATRGLVDLSASTGTLGAGAVTGQGSVTIFGNGAVTLTSAQSLGGAASVVSYDTLTVNGAVSGATGAVAAAINAVRVGDVRGGTGGVTLVSVDSDATAGALSGAGAIAASAGTSLTLASAASSGSSVKLTTGSGSVDVAGAIASKGFVDVEAGAGVRLGSVTDTGTGASSLRAKGGTLTVVGATSVGGALDVQGEAGVTMAGVTTGGAASVTSGSGAVALDRLGANGSIAITAATSVRADAVQGGATTITAGGDVAGRTVAGVSATVASLAVDAGGGATIGAVQSGGAVRVTAAGAATLGGAIGAGGDLTVSGRSVTLGSSIAPVTQVASGQVSITAGSGGIAGAAGLVLRSDANGAGARDVTLRSGGGIAFASDSLIAGGPDRQSALRINATSGAAITLGMVEARTIASPGATTFAHDGPVTTGRLATRDALAITLSGGAALTTGVVEVRAGDLSLDAGGGLATGAINASSGETRLAGASVATGAIASRSLTATARSGSAALGAVDATAGGIAITAARDIRVPRATATGAVTLTSSGGDVSGGVSTAGVQSATLASSGGSVTVRATATDGVAGAVLLGAVAGATGVDVTGRTITAGSLVSSGGTVNASTQRDVAGIADQRMTLGSVDAAGAVTLATGNAVASSNGTLSVDSVRSSGGSVTITTIGGSIGSRAGSARTSVAAPSGSVTIDVGGAAVLGSVSGRTTTIAAASLDVTRGEATAGALALTARTGALQAGSASASGAATLTAATGLSADVVATGGALTATAGTDLRLPQVTAGGDATLRAGGTATLGNVTTPTRLGITGAGIAATGLSAGMLDVAGGAGGVAIGGANVAGAATVRSDAGIVLGTLEGGLVDARAVGTLVADRLTARGGLTVAAASARIGVARVTAGAATLTAGDGGFDLRDVDASGDLTATTSGTLSAGTIGSGGRLTASSAAADVSTLRAGGDAAVTATAGALRVGQATTGGALTLRGASVDLGSGVVGGAADLRSTAGMTVGTLDAASSRLVAGGALVAGTLTARDRIDASGASMQATRVAVAQGGAALSSTAGALAVNGVTTAGDTTLTASGGDLRLGTASAGGALNLTGSGAVAVTGTASAAGRLGVDGAAVTLGTAGTTARQAGGEVAVVARTGTVTVLGSTTLAATRALAVAANGSGGSIALAPESIVASSAGDVALATRGAAALGTVTASAGAIRIDAADAALTRAVSAREVTLTNVATAGTTRIGDTAVGNEAEFAAGTTRFDLTNAEVGLIAAPAVTIASGTRDVVVGALALGSGTGSTRFAIGTTGRTDMLGRFVAAGSTGTRTIAIGIGASATASGTGVIRVAASPADGGRLLVDGAALELTADRVGVGYDRDFLDAIGYRSTALGVDQVTREYVARPTSTLYNASALGATPYSDGVLVRSGTLRLTYGRYALIQNTGRPGEQSGVVIGSFGGTGTGTGPALRLSTPGSTDNTFGLFGTINGVSSQAAALLGPNTVEIDTGVSPVASRINGCVIGSGAGCLNTSIAQPSLNLFDTSRAEIVRTADDLTLPFDPLIGTNNEALYLDAAADTAAPDCEGDKPCPTKP